MYIPFTLNGRFPRGGEGEKQGFVNAHHGENEERQDLVDVKNGGNERGQCLFEAQLGRNEENDVSRKEDVQGVEKKVEVRG